jgi:hypothetical protein
VQPGSVLLTLLPLGEPQAKLAAYLFQKYDLPNGKVETLTTHTNGVPSTVRNFYSNDDTLFSTTPLAPSAAFNLTNQSAAEALNALNAFLGAVRSGQPVPLLTSGFNLIYTLGGHPPNLQGANIFVCGTTHSIAAYVQGAWTTGLNGSENSAANDLDWKITA